MQWDNCFEKTKRAVKYWQPDSKQGTTHNADKQNKTLNTKKMSNTDATQKWGKLRCLWRLELSKTWRWVKSRSCSSAKYYRPISEVLERKKTYLRHTSLLVLKTFWPLLKMTHLNKHCISLATSLIKTTYQIKQNLLLMLPLLLPTGNNKNYG